VPRIDHDDFLQHPFQLFFFLQNILWFDTIRGVTERCGRTLGTSCTHQNKRKSPCQHVPGNIWSVSYSCKNTSSSSALMCGQGYFGDCLVGPHVLPHRLTWSATATGSCTTGSQSTNVVHAWWCSVLGEMFSVTPVMADG
jgi:hypothetical protein